MDIVQTFRRLGQKMSGWNNAIDMQWHQLKLVEKLYNKNGLHIKITSYACPEQYEIFKDEKQVGYYRLRHGEFRVDYPDHNGETLFEDWKDVEGDGIFEEKERLKYLTKAMRIILNKLKGDKNG